MTATLSYSTVGEFEAVVLQNRSLRAVVIPELGGRVWELTDRARERQWIWHRPGVKLTAPPAGAAYDDVWAGGWEELFPNDAPGGFEGRQLPDHGEWWTMAWSAADESRGAAASLRLSARSSIVKAVCEKSFTLRGDDSALTVDYSIRSLEAEPFHFLFKQHLPVRLTPRCRLSLPGGLATPVDPSFGSMVDADGFRWPHAASASGTVDMRIVPEPSSRAREFLYVEALPEAWCGVEDDEHGASLRMSFDSAAFPYVWLFLTYGGWHDLYTAVLEPCTNQPKDLARAVQLGRSSRLEPGGTFQTRVSVRLGALGE